MEYVEALAELVGAESPSKDPAALHGCADVLMGLGARIAGTPAERLVTGDGRPALAWRRGDPQDRGRVLLLVSLAFNSLLNLL